MAVIHISEAEAALNFAGLMAKVHAGEEVRIDDDARTVAVIRSPDSDPPRRTLSEAIRLATERNSTVTLDDQFGDDLEAVIRQHNSEPARDPSELFCLKHENCLPYDT